MLRRSERRAPLLCLCLSVSSRRVWRSSPGLHAYRRAPRLRLIGLEVAGPEDGDGARRGGVMIQKCCRASVGTRYFKSEVYKVTSICAVSHYSLLACTRDNPTQAIIHTRSAFEEHGSARLPVHSAAPRLRADTCACCGHVRRALASHNPPPPRRSSPRPQAAADAAPRLRGGGWLIAVWLRR
jgi:hypothetical protein